MITDNTEARFQQKQYPGVLCATRPGVPFNFSEKAYLLPRDMRGKPMSISGCGSYGEMARWRQCSASGSSRVNACLKDNFVIALQFKTNC